MYLIEIVFFQITILNDFFNVISRCYCCYFRCYIMYKRLNCCQLECFKCKGYHG